MLLGLSRREQNVIILGLVVAFIALFCVYLIQPEWNKFKSKKAELVEAQNRLQSIQNLQKNVNKDTVEQLKKDITALRVNLPVGYETSGFFNMINGYTSKTLVNVKEIDVGDMSENQSIAGTNIVPVTLSIAGTYPQIRSFLMEVENPTRMAHLVSLSINQHQNGLIGNIHFNAYSANSGDASLNDENSIPKTPIAGKNNPYD